MRKTIYLIVMLLTSVALHAQQIQPTFSVDMVSHYMHRGQDLGNVSLQPKLGLQWRGLSISLEGNTGFTHQDYEEMDIILNYEYKGFKIGLLDEWGEDGASTRYFYYGRSTNHQFSAHLGYECSHFSIDTYTFFAGADYKADGSRAYSTYIEVGVPFRWLDLEWEAKVGFTPYESGGIKTQDPDTTIDFFEYSFADHAAVNMISLRATKEITVGTYQLPVFIEAHSNPFTQNARIYVGATLFRL